MPLTHEFVETGGYDCMTDAFYVKRDGKTVAVLDQSDFGQRHLNYSGPDAEAESLARLFAAAPDLLRVLQFILIDANSEIDYEARLIIEKAIAKARGE